MKPASSCAMIAAFAVAATALLPSQAAVGDIIAETAEAATFRLYASKGAAYALETAAEIAAWPVTLRVGESVSATAMDGSEYTIAAGGGSAISAPFPTAEKGGVWTFVGTLDGETRTAKVGVPWSLYGGYGVSLGATGASRTFGIDTQQSGPDRTSRRREVLPIAYSGDDWLRDAAAASLTFLSPSGVSETVSRNGTGALEYAFGENGEWTVTLAMADGTESVAKINATVPGLIISFH